MVRPRVTAVVGMGVSDLQELCQRAVAGRWRQRRGRGGSGSSGGRETVLLVKNKGTGQNQRGLGQRDREGAGIVRLGRNLGHLLSLVTSAARFTLSTLLSIHCSPSLVWPFFWAAPHSSGPLATLHSQPPPIHSSRRHIEKCDKAVNLCVTASHVPGERTSIV